MPSIYVNFYIKQNVATRAPEHFILLCKSAFVRFLMTERNEMDSKLRFFHISKRKLKNAFVLSMHVCIYIMETGEVET